MNIEEVTEAVIARLQEKYFLVEKTYNVGEGVPMNLTRDMFIENICEITCKHFGITKTILQSPRHGKANKNDELSLPQIRSIICKLCRELPENDISYMAIGKAVNKDHVTVIYACQRFDYYYKNPIFVRQYFSIKNKVNESLKLK